MNAPKIRIKKGPEIEWIAAYRGTNNFLLSLQAQAEREGLSPNQITRVQENMQREQPTFPTFRPIVATPQQPPQLRNGDQIEVKHFIAERIAQDAKAPVAFRNFEVVEMLRESAKAIQVRVRMASKIASSCHLCGQPLDTEISRASGVGPVCAEKLGFKRPKLTDAADILAKLDKMAQDFGIIGPVWIPKSQIVDTARVASDDEEMDHQFAEREHQQEQEAFRKKEEERERMSRNSN
jgi:hypothetical protein